MALRARRLALLTCCFSLFLAQLDVTVVNLGLPAIQRTLGGGLAGLQWVVDAYVLMLGSVAISAGAAGDRFGRRRVFRIGLVAFVAASAGCSAAPSLGVLLACRALQGASASMLMPSTLAIIADVFTDRSERARAVGIWAGVSGLAMIAGPLLGGALVAGVGWRSLFWINIPIGATALAMTYRFVPESRADRPRALDPVGQVLLIAGLGALTLGLIQAPRWGWSSASTLATIGGATAILTLFGRLEVRAREPMLDPRLLRRPALAGATGFALLGYAATMGFLFLNTLYLQRIRGLSPLHAGVAIVPATIAMASAAPTAGRLTANHYERQTIVLGGALIAAGLGFLSVLSARPPMGALAGAYVLIGLGWGALNPPITTLAMSALPRSRSGTAAAIAGCARQAGATLGVALMGSLVAGQLAGADNRAATTLRAAHHTVTSAFRVGYLTGVGAAIAIILLALVLPISPSPIRTLGEGKDEGRGPTVSHTPASPSWSSPKL